MFSKDTQRVAHICSDVSISHGSANDSIHRLAQFTLSNSITNHKLANADANGRAHRFTEHQLTDTRPHHVLANRIAHNELTN